jgi:hypothetical protein
MIHGEDPGNGQIAIEVVTIISIAFFKLNVSTCISACKHPLI